jgi:hypothetical protein
MSEKIIEATEVELLYKHVTEWTPGYDIRPKNPGDKNYGIHGAELKFVLIGPKGAIQFQIYTNWMPRSARHRERSGPYCLVEPMAADLGYHSFEPRHEDQRPMSESCEYLDGKPCYYDGSGLNAQDPFDILCEDGDEAMWAFLERYYEATFNGAEYPPEAGRAWKEQMQHA